MFKLFLMSNENQYPVKKDGLFFEMVVVPIQCEPHI